MLPMWEVRTLVLLRAGESASYESADFPLGGRAGWARLRRNRIPDPQTREVTQRRL